MRALAIALGAAAVLSAGAAMAQPYSNYTSDPYWAIHQQQHEEWMRQHYRDYGREHWRDDRWRGDRWTRGDWECWNPHAGHFEGVRPGEVQNDLDFSRCRPEGAGGLQPYPGYGYGWR
jgi:hypothetical protein